MAVHQVGGIHERSGLAGLDGFDGFGHQPVVSLSAGLVFACEAHAQTEHLSPPGRVTPCSHPMCCASTQSCTYSLYDARTQSTLSVNRIVIRRYQRGLMPTPAPRGLALRTNGVIYPG